MNTKDNAYYDAFSEEIEAGNIEVDNSNIQRGNRLGLDLVLAVTGAPTEEDAKKGCQDAVNSGELRVIG